VQVEVLCNVVALLLEQAVQQQEKQEHGSVEVADADAPAGAGTDTELSWAADLAGDVMEKVTVLPAAALSQISCTGSRLAPDTVADQLHFCTRCPRLGSLGLAWPA